VKALMIRPTETETRTLDEFVTAMVQIAGEAKATRRSSGRTAQDRWRASTARAARPGPSLASPTEEAAE
jgi:glycine cleavage system protein P-like pyridoxal-binding family